MVRVRKIPASNEPGMARRSGERRLQRSIARALEAIDGIVYAMVGVVFLAAALGMLGYSVWTAPSDIERDGFPLAVVALVNDLLLVMIIMEVLRTVLSYLEERGASLRPFLFIAAISATRRVLAIGAQMSVTSDSLNAQQFRHAMIDLGANAGVILAVVLALYLLNRDVSATGQVVE